MKEKWNKLNREQKEYAESFGTNADTITERQYQILTKENSKMWSLYEWHFNSVWYDFPSI